MNAIMGHLKSAGQISILELDFINQKLEKKVVDSIELKDHAFSLLITNDAADLENLETELNQEKKYYPIIDQSSLNLEAERFEGLNFNDAAVILNKVNSRYVLNNNMHSLESIYSIINHFKTLWISDRSSCLEELWFFIKTNLGAHQITMIVNDIKTNTDKNGNEARAQLCHAVIYGQKIPHPRPANEHEDKLMSDYASDFHGPFSIIEHDAQKARLVIGAKINRSPLLIMAHVTSFNPLQKSLLTALFNGMQE